SRGEQDLLARSIVCLHRIYDLNHALIKRLLAVLTHIDVDQYLVVCRWSVALNARALQISFLQRRTNRVVIGRMRKLYINQRAPSEVYPQRDSMPEQHGKHSRHAEHK